MPCEYLQIILRTVAYDQQVNMKLNNTLRRGNICLCVRVFFKGQQERAHRRRTLRGKDKLQFNAFFWRFFSPRQKDFYLDRPTPFVRPAVRLLF